MPTGKPKCPVCQGKGTLTEDAEIYEFITRDPITAKCMICNGTGILNPSKKLPNGKRAFEVFRKETGTQIDADKGLKRLNVSKKAVINPEAVDTGVGYTPDPPMQETFNTEEKSERGQEPYEAPLFLEMALNPRLNKVLASGKEFLIVTETEPYFLDVYRMIRRQERQDGTWTSEDESRYVGALEAAYDRIKILDSRLRGNDEKEAMNG